MTSDETRKVSRDSLFLFADIRLEGDSREHRIKVRNLSDGGMMGEGPLRAQRGLAVEVHLRNIGPVTGRIAWVQDERFGVAFDTPVKSLDARKGTRSEGLDETVLNTMSRAHRAPKPLEMGTLRKI